MPSRPAAIVPIAVFLSVLLVPTESEPRFDLPYARAGLTNRQAAACLLERFAFGARPGDIDRVVEIGLEKWLDAQLSGSLPDPELEKRLSRFKSLSLSAREIVNTHPRDGIVRNQMVRAGSLDLEKMDRRKIRKKMKAYREEKGYRSLRELNGDLMAQKLCRAVYSENQLVEVLTDFWFNHFNVTIQDGQARAWVLSYERDAIRPNVLGRFRDLLGATARHPAMLYYLDNAQSRASPGPGKRENRGKNTTRGEMAVGGEMMMPESPGRGINENYARELMELHTLGVNGGYTQKDVVEVARAFTGWTVFPPGRGAERTLRQMKRRPRAFVREGDFLFRSGVHDKRGKIILGQKFPPGGGIEEGERVLDMLSKHPSTARRISDKLARRFVSDSPPEALLDRLTRTFLKTDGDLRAMVRTLAASPEFWMEAVQRTKMKSPFELAVSALRALDADVVNPRPVLQWVARMGQPLYRYLSPTGYPDSAEAWANAGTLVSRMNFGLRLAMGRIRGIRLTLPSQNGGDRTTSADQILQTCAALLLPERNATTRLRQLTVMIPETSKRKEAQIAGLILGSPEFQYH